MAQDPIEQRRAEDLEGDETQEHLQKDTAHEVEQPGGPTMDRSDDPVGYGHSIAPPG